MEDHSAPIRLPVSNTDPLERDVAELEAAVALVEGGVATRVLIAGLRRPVACAGIGAILAQEAGLRFALEPDPSTGVMVARVGPRLEHGG